MSDHLTSTRQPEAQSLVQTHMPDTLQEWFNNVQPGIPPQDGSHGRPEHDSLQHFTTSQALIEEVQRDQLRHQMQLSRFMADSEGIAEATATNSDHIFQLRAIVEDLDAVAMNERFEGFQRRLNWHERRLDDIQDGRDPRWDYVNERLSRIGAVPPACRQVCSDLTDVTWEFEAFKVQTDAKIARLERELEEKEDKTSVAENLNKAVAMLLRKWTARVNRFGVLGRRYAWRRLTSSAGRKK